MIRYIRQGDVLLVRLRRLPRSAHRRQETVLSIPGENGHRHLLEGAELYEANGRALAVVPKGKTAILEHDEHPSVSVPHGVWEIRLPRTYDWPDEPRMPQVARPAPAPARAMPEVESVATPSPSPRRERERSRPYFD